MVLQFLSTAAVDVLTEDIVKRPMSFLLNKPLEIGLNAITAPPPSLLQRAFTKDNVTDVVTDVCLERFVREPMTKIFENSVQGIINFSRGVKAEPKTKTEMLEDVTGFDFSKKPEAPNKSTKPEASAKPEVTKMPSINNVTRSPQRRVTPPKSGINIHIMQKKMTRPSVMRPF